jgi:hypothetical protein
MRLRRMLTLVAMCMLANGSAVFAADLDAKAIRAVIDGIYVLDEWHADTGVLRPPQVQGRLVLLNNMVVYSVDLHIADATQVTISGYGGYVLSPATFSYSYETWSAFTRDNAGVTVSNKLPWEGARKYVAAWEGDGLFLRTEAGDEFRFSPAGMKVSLRGKVLRVWRRVPNE